MEKSEYDKKLIELKESYEESVFKLRKEFALSNNKYKVGDVVSDHYKTIKIEYASEMYMHNNYPALKYKGIVLKKDGTPAKNQSDNIVCQLNIKQSK